ncbi:hypothetical protein CERZMDRAFT_96322 [Cercospora zeae-maydis SCOH1-5]|uniref:Uncharacterized protein n=1 Tax=Cercospora zeae-maydis SCOH1-5 TaxID=717836 RepID=A0A6A6FJ72_9PEZI|nr:hypothetical protein CERZMDRAFT_96322 [Cercospora zeae-maydis SCOH1-5]
MRLTQGQCEIQTFLALCTTSARNLNRLAGISAIIETIPQSRKAFEDGAVQNLADVNGQPAVRGPKSRIHPIYDSGEKQIYAARDMILQHIASETREKSADGHVSAQEGAKPIAIGGEARWSQAQGLDRLDKITNYGAFEHFLDHSIVEHYGLSDDVLFGSEKSA